MDPCFQRGQKVKFHFSSFLIRTVGFMSSVQLAIANNEVFEVVSTFGFFENQYLLVKNSAGERPFEPLNAELFEAT